MLLTTLLKSRSARLVLTQESMTPSKLMQHFESCHCELAEKSVDYFGQISEHLKNRRLDSGGIWAKQIKNKYELYLQ